MNESTWPDLSSWYPLPDGGTIPKGMRYAVDYGEQGFDVAPAWTDFTPKESYRYRTEHPVPVPPPTEEGTRIIACGPWSAAREMALTYGKWRTNGGAIRDDITRRTPTTTETLMIDRIDHAAEARKHIGWTHDWQEREGDTKEVGLATAVLAQTHATLALVEQQKVANVIALSQAEDGNGWTSEQAVAAVFREHWDDESGQGHCTIAPDIAAALGVEVRP